jgi:hypothetical protein
MHGVCVTGNRNGGLQLGLAFVFRGGNMNVLNASVHFASMVDNLVFKVQYLDTTKNLNITEA